MLRHDFRYQSEAAKYTEDELVAILSKYNRRLDNVGEDIAIIRDWLKLQKHILIETSDREILYFLVACKFSFEKTKEKLNMYYCIRNILPEYYKGVKPSSKSIQDILSVATLVSMPNLTSDLNRLIIYVVDGKMASMFKSDVVTSYLTLMLDTQPILDMCLSNEYILDFTNISLDIMLKFSIMDLKKLMTVLEKVYSTRIARIHIINAPSYCDTLVTALKAFLKEKMKKRLLMHKTYESLYEYIPKSMLPSDFGGEGDSIADIKALFIKLGSDLDEHFEKINGNGVVDENLRPASLKNDEILGFHGSFRKLQVD